MAVVPMLGPDVPYQRLAQAESKLIQSVSHARPDALQLIIRKLGLRAPPICVHLHSRVGATSAQQSEMLRTAQKICQEAEDRADAAERCAAALLLPEVRIRHLENAQYGCVSR